MTAATIPQAKVLRLMELMRAMCGNPMSIEQIADKLDIHVRNAYRYLALIEQLGVNVKRTNRNVMMYYIDQCPCCGREK
jgi:predicted DNA-binding transcriptional regulator YafY